MGSILSLCREPERGFLGTLRKQQQLCRSCQGCVPSTIGTILTFPTGKEKSPNEGPIPAFPKGKVCATTSSNTRRTNSRPLGRVREGLTISYFFTVAAAVVMHGMTVGMVATTRRKTRFPTGVTDSHKKAKPTTDAMAFCVDINHK